MSDEKKPEVLSVASVPSDSELLLMVLERLGPVVASVRTIRGLGAAIANRLEDGDVYQDTLTLVASCTQIIEAMEPMRIYFEGVQAQRSQVAPEPATEGATIH